MKRLYLLTFFAFTCIATFAQTSTTITDASQDFAFKLFNNILANRESYENVNVSPLSAQIALSMLLNGANGETREEIMKALSYKGFTIDEINAFSNMLLDDVTKRPEFNYNTNGWMDEETALNEFNTRYPLCELTNGIWMRSDIIFQDAFVKTMKEVYYAGFDNCDFTTMEGVDKVNDWVNEHTHGLIKKIFNEPQSEELAIVLANALYFKGAWTVQFEDELTHEEPFYLPDGKAVNVKMMNVREAFRTFTTENFKTITLWYGYNGKFSMTIFLPIDENVMPELKLEDWKATFAYISGFDMPINLNMPKFEFEDKNDLIPTLENLGMHLAFSNYADFSNQIVDRKVKVDKVYQLSNIKVNETGTEAAAVTVIDQTEFAGFDDSDCEDFIINRPFYFTIEDRQTQSLLFIGRVSDFTGDKFEVATSIKQTTTPSSNNSCYDLSGRQVNPQTYKGIYIVNGKKMIGQH